MTAKRVVAAAGVVKIRHPELDSGFCYKDIEFSRCGIKFAKNRNDRFVILSLTKDDWL